MKAQKLSGAVVTEWAFPMTLKKSNQGGSPPPGTLDSNLAVKLPGFGRDLGLRKFKIRSEEKNRK